MKRRDFLQLTGGFASLAATGSAVVPFLVAAEEAPSLPRNIVGMYIHEGWPYNHPYAARTWTLEDYRGYAYGLKKIGYNALVIWPILETMPDPLTRSDLANIEKAAAVINILHNEFGMRAFLTLCPNIVAENKVAPRYTFERRPLFTCASFINPADETAVKRMIEWREQLLRPLAKMDGIAIIDSDPGGYPGSTNEQFVHLLGEHRKMLNRLRPGIELYYWMHVGWEAYCRYYATGKFAWGTPKEALDILMKLKKLNPAPWGITIHTIYVPPNGTDLKLAQKMGLASTALAFNYGAIEGEPSFPMTNFGGDVAFKAGRARAPRGVVGNAQTHCVQLPNTFAFVRGARGESHPSEADYVEFADNLVTGRGRAIVRGWQTLAGKDPKAMRAMAAELESIPATELKPGRLTGLLFGNPRRFISDLVMELRLRASYQDFIQASEENQSIKKTFQKFLAEAKAWQQKTGYQSVWRWPGMEKALRKFNSPKLNSILNELVPATVEPVTSRSPGLTPFDRIKNFYKMFDYSTPRLLEAMEEVAGEMGS